ncbi:MAG: TfoX/Sxy family protein [bacterium]
MAYDEGLAQILRDALDGEPIQEKRMMGGLCFMWHGHMLCGVHKGGAMFRVGKPNYAAALGIDGVQPMAFTGRPMSGFVDCADEAVADDTRRIQLLTLARSFVSSLPPK